MTFVGKGTPSPGRYCTHLIQTEPGRRLNAQQHSELREQMRAIPNIVSYDIQDGPGPGSRTTLYVQLTFGLSADQHLATLQAVLDLLKERGLHDSDVESYAGSLR